MSDRSSIDWTDATWNPVSGCSKVSPGCNHCYAETLSLRFGWSKYPWSEQWAAQNVVLKPERLDQPLRWRRPRRVFVNSMSDLFHPQVPFEFIDRVFAVMVLAHRHTFQVLTKRPERMAQYLRDYAAGGRHIWEACQATPMPGGRDKPAGSWPIRNVWLGTSVEDQKRADERIPHLMKCPAAVRFLSCEPLLGPVNLKAIAVGDDVMDAVCGWVGRFDGFTQDGRGGEEPSAARVDWVIAGGESGPHARACDEQWLRDLRDQCVAAGVAYFLKQLGGHPNKRSHDQAVLDGQMWRQYPAPATATL